MGFLAGSLATGERVFAAESAPSAALPLPEKTNGVYQIDLPTALQLAGAQNLDIQIAREKLAEARANEESVRISTNYSGQVEHAVAAGIAFTGDLLRLRVQTEKNHLTLRQAQEQQRIAAARLAQTLRLDPKIELIPRENDIVPMVLLDLNSALDSLVAQALASRPELKQNRALVDAARNVQKGALYGPLIPSLGAQVFLGGLGGGKTHDPNTFGESEDYQLTLGWRIGPGGLLDRGRVHATEA
ncbi:MAG: hypothetical protein ABI651_07335 [Verrucomicrobiota bacterium]